MISRRAFLKIEDTSQQQSNLIDIKGSDSMDITPLIPDGYNGPIKQLTCRICKHIFYISQADYSYLAEVSYCHECSLILTEELGKHREAPGRMFSKQTSLPASLPSKQVLVPVLQRPEPPFISSQPSIHVPQPRTIDRDKMTVEQLLEEAKMLDKTWRYKEALASYEQVLQCDPRSLAALYGKGEMLSRMDRSKDTLAIYDEIIHLDPTAAKAHEEKGWALISLKNYKEAQASFEYALQLDASMSRAQYGKYFLSSSIFHDQGAKKNFDSLADTTAARETLLKPCQSAQDYYKLGNALVTLDRDDEAFRAFAHCIELDPLDLNVYQRVGILYFVREDHEKSLTIYNQALQIFPDCAKLHEKRAQVLVLLERYQEALDACNRALQLDNMDAIAYSEKGEILHQLRRFKEAFDAFDMAISLKPDVSIFYRQKADMLADWGKYDDAFVAYDQESTILVHPKIVQEILDHSQIGITMDIYSHVLPTMQQDAMNKLHQAFMSDGEREENDGNIGDISEPI